MTEQHPNDDVDCWDDDPASYWARRRRDRTNEWRIAEVLPTVWITVVIVAFTVALAFIAWEPAMLAATTGWFVLRRAWLDVLDRGEESDR